MARHPFVLTLLLLAACHQELSQVHTAVDQCVLKEYLAECEGVLANPEEATQCRQQAPQQATRVLAGIEPQCLPAHAATR